MKTVLNAFYAQNLLMNVHYAMKMEIALNAIIIIF